MLIHGPLPNGAAAGQRHAGMPQPRQKRPQRQNGSAHGLDQLIGRARLQRAGAVKAHAAALAHGLHVHAHALQQAAHGGHVLQARHVGQAHGVCGEQRGAHFGQGGVFCAGDDDFALQAAAAANEEFVHEEIDAGRGAEKMRAGRLLHP